jgi:hypothetical protein
MVHNMEKAQLASSKLNGATQRMLHSSNQAGHIKIENGELIIEGFEIFIV